MTRLVVATLLVLGCQSKPAPPAHDDASTIDTSDAFEIPACATPSPGEQISFRQVGLVDQAILVATPPMDLDRLFVIEKVGTIRILRNEQLVPTPFLDLSVDAAGPVLAGGDEQGLLGLAFHPHYATNGLFYVYYTKVAGMLRNVLARCSVSSTDPDRADPTSCVELISIPDFASNHNGGMIEFGKDGYLYIGTGDGGGKGDPQLVSQNPNSLLGKILRIDVDGTSKGLYGIPADNPFANGGGSPEVFILGLRNPWRFSFDRLTGDLWIGDVGQDTVEELTVLRPAQQNGANLGWSIYEGMNCFRPPCTPPANNVFPQAQRLHPSVSAIIAGQTYRGTCYPDLVGWHFYTDYQGDSKMSKARLHDDGTVEVIQLTIPAPGRPTSLHEDARGEIYVTSLFGNVYHLEAHP